MSLASSRVTQSLPRGLTIVASKSVTHKQKIILLRDVAGLGKEGDLVLAPVGYVRNYLVPQRHAVPASSQVLSRLQAARDAEEREAQQALAGAQAAALALGTAGMVVIWKKVGGTGHIYGSVTPAEVVAVIAQQTGVVLDKRGVSLPVITMPGTYTAVIKLHSDVKAECELVIQSEGTP